MPPKQKAVKMDLSTFLNDDSLGGSWADDDVDFNTIEIPSKKGAFGATGISAGGANPMDPAFGGFDGQKRDFAEFPVPDAPPYRARFNNLPWDVTEDEVGAYAESCADEGGSVERVSAPRDMNDPTRLKGFAFVTYVTKSQLENALKCSGQDMNGRRVYIAVAAPDKGGFGSRMGREDVNLDWGSARGSGFGASRGGDDRPRRDFGEERPRREEPNLDWGHARGSGVLPPREPREPREDRPRREFGEERPKREEPNLDWGSARGSGALPPREPREPREDRPRREFGEERPKREEPNLDWGSARGSGALSERPRREFKEHNEPREERPKREEPSLDWGSARGSGSLPPREPREPREPRTHSNPKKISAVDNLDSWTRGSQLPARNAAPAAATPAASKRVVSQKKEEAPKSVAQKSAFAVLAGEDDDEDDEEELVEKTEKLSV